MNFILLHLIFLLLQINIQNNYFRILIFRTRKVSQFGNNGNSYWIIKEKNYAYVCKVMQSSWTVLTYLVLHVLGLFYVQFMFILCTLRQYPEIH